MLSLAVAVATAGLVGSLHCVGMCGPLVVAAQQGARRGRESLLATAAYQFGRALAYVLVGATAGLAGSAVQAAGHDLFGLQRTATVAAGVVMIALGTAGVLSYHRRLPRWLRRSSTRGSRWARSMGRVLSPRLVKLTSPPSAPGSLRTRPPVGRGFVLGAVSSLMPCGWLYAFAVIAAGTAHPGRGAVVMLSFWLGTLPALLATAAFAQRAQRVVGPYSRLVMGWLLVGVGLFTLLVRAPIDLSAPTAGCCDHEN